MSSLAVITAVDAEARAISRRLQLPPSQRVAVGRLWRGGAGAQEVVLLRCGMGARRAACATRWLLRHGRPAALLAAGFAGGLQPALAPGDAVLAEAFLTLPAGAAPPCCLHPAPHLARRVAEAAAAAALACHTGPLLSVPAPVSSAAAKRQLGQASGALAVDLETYAVARLACRHRVPFAALRVVFDACHEALPPAAARLPAADGGLAAGRLLAVALRHPSLLLALPRLGARARLAGRQLAAWVASTLAVLEEAAW